MTWQIDRSLHWTDHYVEYGFAKIERAVGPEFTNAALAEVRRVLGHEELPFDQWTTENTPSRSPVPVTQNPILSAIYDHPAVRDLIATMFGALSDWNRAREFQLFVSPFNEKAQAIVRPVGHIDFVNTPIPILGSGFIFQVALAASEPFSGNLTLFPGTHKAVQRALVENPDRRYPADLQSLLRCEPFEFVAEPGDIVLFHHLVGHAGNENHGANRTPRIALNCQALRKGWLHEIDPDTPCLSTWARSVALSGKYRTRQDEEQWIKEYQAAHRQRQAQVVAGPDRYGIHRDSTVSYE